MVECWNREIKTKKKTQTGPLKSHIKRMEKTKQKQNTDTQKNQNNKNKNQQMQPQTPHKPNQSPRETSI